VGDLAGLNGGIPNETAEADDVNAAPDTDDEFIEIEVTDEDGK
jgi:hypothetical protein